MRLSYLCSVAAVLIFATGCSSFHYTPKYAQTYSTVANNTGLAIQTGHDVRPVTEITPGWAKNAESIIARALRDETKHAKLFQRVKIHDDSVNLKKYSLRVGFRVLKFQCYNQASPLEKAGRQFLRFEGIQGLLLSESIPSKYLSEVSVEFEVLDAATQQLAFTKTYTATRTIALNGYQGKQPKIAQTSDALEAVLTQFVGDLVKLPLCQQAVVIP